MFDLPDDRAIPSVAARGDHATNRGTPFPPRALLAVESIGYLVPDATIEGRVHSVFTRACNIACGDLLLTLVDADLADGPTTLRLARGTFVDLRLFFRPGDRVRSRDGFAHSRGAALRLAGATVWRPAPLRPIVPAAHILANLRVARMMVAHRRRTHSSVVDRDGALILAALANACRAVDADGARSCIERLVGWGEGLTPAGDDVLVGGTAALGALAGESSDRRRFLRAFSVSVMAQTHRTTPIAAHYLRLAAQGHFNADVTRLRDALLCEGDPGAVASALAAALGAGASSGADMVTGMLACLSAWIAADPAMRPMPVATMAST